MLSNGASPSIDPANPGDIDAVALLTGGIYAYLLEVDGYRSICRRHEETATVEQDDGVVCVVRCFEPAAEAVEHLRTAVQLLPPPRRDTQPNHHHGEGDSQPPREVRQDVIWEGRLLHVRAGVQCSSAVLRVEVRVSPWESDFPELPLRTVATALRCHEFLLPDGVARAQPIREADQPKAHGVHAYLKCAMAPNLYASQCI